MYRLCVLCYYRTIGNKSFCRRCYDEYKQVIDQAIEGDETWLKELQRLTQVEYRRIEKENEQLALYDGEF